MSQRGHYHEKKSTETAEVQTDRCGVSMAQKQDTVVKLKLSEGTLAVGPGFILGT